MSKDLIPRGERTRSEILQAALGLFTEHGYHGTSMRQIAHEAGIALGGIYNHFSGKEQIFKTVFIELHPFWDTLPLMNAAQGETIEEFVRDAAQRMINKLRERPDFLNLMFIELVEFNGQHIPQFFEIFFPQFTAFSERFLAKRKEMRDIPLLMATRAFIGLFLSYVITDLFIGKRLPAEGRENALDYFIEIYLHGILKSDFSEEAL
ncbi:MAG TPA: TetR/AcrR family transcriptional regulator [Anaerolineales bacterium]|jgi:AcrR family transcriptional regulator|nr:TetR/AcrR family transcriptional regulator [Anaerolineales bacterium]